MFLLKNSKLKLLKKRQNPYLYFMFQMEQHIRDTCVDLRNDNEQQKRKYTTDFVCKSRLDAPTRQYKGLLFYFFLVF